ncbi:DoxX family protein [Aliifodinibius sp. S!AR15-10]|uniref:DoxX family protein n=1 Tax=Aliifodinibius sp. S!AR15-10 TaxID=2950437 RepID=UPI002855C559|nr:DoxX family protein [Aliifodinibius sp. S!AR15-10]MDR8394483.1 DoxX family protein [Aliifodinibius sp. S!AR15-10]
MEKQEIPVIKNLKKGIHWIAIAVLVYIFGYAGVYKIIGVQSMMENMASIGFGPTPTMLIGLAETTGVAGVIIGLFYRPAKIISLLGLLPFAIGAFTVHMSYHHSFPVYLNSLLVCIMPLVILWADEEFTLQY